ncbi:hypothetical protein [Mucilaginibacter sp. HD30]
MTTCLIYGQNGLDLDVALNLQAFYKKLGYWTVFSEKLFDANLLVILRAVDKPIEADTTNFEQIHVYDYGGWGYDECIRSLDYAKTYIFTTAPQHKQHIANKLAFPDDHIYIAFPPVETSLWVEKVQLKKYDFVHIGNFKKIDDSDAVREKFNAAVKALNADIWGMNWQLEDKNKYHGKSGLFDVSKIYARSKYALGLMYPFQRGVTFSGRFWHAPLNGCYLISEKSLYSADIPGVIETDYSVEDITNSVKNADVPDILSKKALQYWDLKNRDLQAIIIENKPIQIRKNLLPFYFIKVSIKNTLRLYYQKYELFKFLGSAK